VFLAVRAASTAEEHLGPGHLVPTADSSWQVRQSRRLCARSQALGWAERADRWTERRWEKSDCKHTHPFGEAPSRRAHRGIGQNHTLDWWAEAGARGCNREVPGCEVYPSGVPAVVGSARNARNEEALQCIALQAL